MRTFHPLAKPIANPATAVAMYCRNPPTLSPMPCSIMATSLVIRMGKNRAV